MYEKVICGTYVTYFGTYFVQCFLQKNMVQKYTKYILFLWNQSLPFKFLLHNNYILNGQYFTRKVPSAIAIYKIYLFLKKMH